MMMNLKEKICFLYLLLSVFFSSCIEDGEFASTEAVEGGQPVTVRLNAASELQQQTDDGDAEDRTIGSLRVLIYEAGTEELRFNIPVAVPTPATLNIRTGIYDFVFIANENSDAVLKSHLTSTDNADIDHLSKLRALTFNRTAFDVDKNIPMVRLVEHVEVSGDNTIRTPEMTQPITGTWSVPMDRAGIRVQLGITLTPNQYLEWSVSPKITITNITGEAFVLPGIDNSSSQDAAGEDFAASGVADAMPGFISAPDANGNVTVIYDRLIMPELFLSPSNNIADNVMKLSMTFGGKVKSGMLKTADGDAFGYALPRNTFLRMTATVKVDDLEINAEVLPWNEVNEDVSFNMYHLTVKQTDYYFTTEGGTQPINVDTDYPGGWSVSEDNITWAHTAPTPGNNVFTTSPYDPASAVTAPRTGTFTISAGNLKKIINIIQFPPVDDVTDQVMSNSYVGAFWKANQQGERLLRSAGVNGKWAAIVAEGADWIHLDTLVTTDKNVGWLPGAVQSNVMNGNDSGFDVAHTVRGNSKCVGGVRSASTPQIYYRIGLNSTYTPTANAPARYGVVIFSYSNHTKMQRVWIRQGEGDDYLFGVGDPDSNGATVTRTVAAKFSPYNLTAKSGLNTQEQTRDNACFAEYPSQAGAMYQWAAGHEGETLAGTDLIPYAWSAINQNLDLGEWVTNAIYFLHFWNEMEPSELCPPGYHRPNDGSTTAVVASATAEVANSELLQSLFLTPATMESRVSEGYYADGFFDRRLITTPTSNGSTGTPLSVVDASTNNMACRGAVLYNPHNHASLFFPYVGGRIRGANADVLVPQYTGTAGCYWSTSSYSRTNSYLFRAQGGTAAVTDGGSTTTKFVGVSVRCVHDN